MKPSYASFSEVLEVFELQEKVFYEYTHQGAGMENDDIHLSF